MEKNLLGRWEAVNLVCPDTAYDFEPGEWQLEFFEDGKTVTYCEGDPVGIDDYAFRDGMLTINGEIPQKTELSDSKLIIHEKGPHDNNVNIVSYSKVPCAKQVLQSPRLPLMPPVLPAFDVLDAGLYNSEIAAMENRKFTFDYKHYASLGALPDEDRELADRARQACRMAFAPHSGFRVGAAARLTSGRIISASNQESDVFPAGICAERALLFHHLSHHPENPITVMAIASDPARRECSPCGICRQTLADTEKRQGTSIRVMMVGPDTVSEVATARDLLPFGFEL